MLRRDEPRFALVIQSKRQLNRSPPAVFSAAVEQTTRRDIRRLSLSRCGYLGATEREQQYLSARCRFPLFLRRFPATRDIFREGEFNDNVTN